MNNVRRIFVLAALVLTCAATASADSIVFTLVPASGNISGAPGQTVGWGFFVQNTSATNYLVAGSVNSDLFQHGTPNAFFLDFVLAPGASLTVNYDQLAGTGLFEFTWDATAPLGFTNSGTFILSSDFYDDDPLNGGNFVISADDASAAYSVTVTGDTQTVPEPATALLLAVGVAGIFGRKYASTKQQ